MHTFPIFLCNFVEMLFQFLLGNFEEMWPDEIVSIKPRLGERNIFQVTPRWKNMFSPPSLAT